MRCPHCHVEFHVVLEMSNLTPSGTLKTLLLRTTSCPKCKEVILFLQPFDNPQHIEQGRPTSEGYLAFPRHSGFTRAHVSVPDHLAALHREAHEVLSISAKASAALSRRLLQTILKEQGYDSDNLATQIDNVLDEQDARKALPSALHSTVDAIRSFGNFSAHPITDTTSLQVIDVEPEEAEWCLSIIADLFDHYYVRPALAQQRKADLDAKLQAAGKSPSK